MKSLVFLFGFFLLMLPLAAQGPSKNDSLIIYNQVAVYLRQHPGQSVSIGLVREGRVKLYFIKELNGELINDLDSLRVFELGAISSLYTNFILNSLVIESKLNADEDVRKYLPGNYPHMQTNYSYVKVKHLATHTSGLPRLPRDFKLVPGYDSLNPYAHYRKENILNGLNLSVLESNPGESMNYSAFGQAILQLIIERRGEQSYDSLLYKFISKPFGFRATGTQIKALKGINSMGDSVLCWQMNDFSAAGGVRASVKELTVFLQILMSRDHRASLMMRAPVYSGKPMMSLGWYKKERHGQTLFWHSGLTYGYSGFVGFIDETNSGIVVLTNKALSVESLALSILRALK